MEVKRDILWRVYLCFIAVIIVSLIIFLKAFYIQQIDGSYWRSKSDSLHQKIEDIEADRGTIYSADGEMLSTSIPEFDIYVDFKADGLVENDGKLFKDNLDSLSYCLANLFKDHTKSDYKKILSNGYRSGTRYFPLLKKVSFEQYQELKDFPLVRLGKNKSGFIADVKNIRLNPYQLLAYRTIGLERANAQKIGLEKTYDSVLQGTKGQRLVRYIAGGVAVPVNEDYQIEPENGSDIVTTIDTHIQDIAENALMKMMLQSQSVYGTCIVMETHTGQIKAMANLGRQKNGTYWEDYNYAMSATEPGSTIKLVTLLAALSEGRTTINDLVEVGSAGQEYVGVRNVNDAERAPKPVLSVEECFAHSSNVGMSKIAYQNFASQPQKFLQYIHQFHMDSITGIDLLGEGKPSLTKVNKSREGLEDLLTISFGYGIQVTPLQTLTLYNSIANNGTMVKPYLVSKIQNDGVVKKEFSPVVLRQNICSPSVVKDAQECMKAVTTFGTAKLVFPNSPYPIAGKTGTAHVSDGTLGYRDGIYQASFVGYFPADKPQYTCIVVIKTKPFAPLHFGGQLAAPVFKEVADRLYTMYVQNNGTPYSNATKNDSINYIYAGAKKDVMQVFKKIGVPYVDSSNTQYIRLSKENNTPVFSSNAINAKQMPQLAGMGLKDALFVCENIGLKVRVKGKGKVAAQSIIAGQQIIKGQAIDILLN